MRACASVSSYAVPLRALPHHSKGDETSMEKALKKWWPLFILPTMAAFTIGFLIPFVWGLYLSFCEFTTVNDAVWVGLNNYVLAFTDPSSYFTHSLWYTAPKCSSSKDLPASEKSPETYVLK